MRIISLDYMKFWAAWFVVCLHMVDILGEKIPDYMIFLESVGRFSVPFFFTVTGYMIASKLKYEDYYNSYNNEIVANYIKKIFKIFIVWSIVHILALNLIEILKVFIGYKSIEQINLEIPGIGFLYYGYGILWYLIAVCWSVGIFFILNRFININKIIIITTILFILGMFGEGQVFYNGILPFNTRDGLFFGLPYFSVGFYFYVNKVGLKENDENFSKKDLFTILLVIFNFVITFIQIRYIYNNIKNNMDTDIMPLIYINNILIFYLCIKFNKYFKSGYISKLGRGSIGIYLVHMFYIILLSIIIKILPMIRSLIIDNFYVGVVCISVISILSFYSYNLITLITYRIISYLNKNNT